MHKKYIALSSKEACQQIPRTAFNSLYPNGLCLMQCISSEEVATNLKVVYEFPNLQQVNLLLYQLDLQIMMAGILKLLSPNR